MRYYAQEKRVVPHIIPELKREINILQDALAFIKTYRLIKAMQPDIVHTHTAKAGFLGRTAALLFRAITGKHVLCIHTFHGHVFEGYFNKTIARFFLLIEIFLARVTAAIVTVSDSVKEELCALRIAPREKIFVIPLGLELDRFLTINNEQKFKERAFRIGIIGRLVPVKNHRMFLKAASRLIHHNPGIPLEFMVIGDGQLRSELERYAFELGLKNQVLFMGWQKDLALLLADLDIVALTSINEGTPVSLIEAMAAARAVVSTEVGGVADVLGVLNKTIAQNYTLFNIRSRGITVKPNDHESLAAAFLYLIKNEAVRKKMGQEGRAFVKDGFSKNRLVKDMVCFYEKLLSKNKKSNAKFVI